MLTREESLRRRNEFDANLQMGVKAFNEATGRDRHLQARKARESSDTDIDPNTGMVRSDLTFNRACPLCGSRTSEVLFTKAGFPHRRCTQCEMTFVSPALREQRLHSMYQGEDSYTRVLMNETQQEMDRKRFGYGLDVVQDLGFSGGKLLDVGCGPGTFLHLARSRGWEVQGIEWNRWCIQRLHSLNIAVVDAPLEQAGFAPASFTCVSAWSVLEHVLEPRRFLSAIRSMLPVGGLVLLMVPNVDSLLVRILHENAATFCGSMHVNFFNAETLQAMLASCDLEVAVCETFLTELGSVHNHLAFKDPYLGDGHPVLDGLSPGWIHDHLMGSQLFCVAKAT